MKFSALLVLVLAPAFLLVTATAKAQTPSLQRYSFGTTTSDEQSTAVRQLSNGYIYLGGTVSQGPLGGSDITLSKIISTGDTMRWTQHYGTANGDYCYYLDNIADSGIVLIGTTYPAGSSYPNGLIIKTDTAGAVLFQETYGLPGNSESFTFVEHTSDNGFIVCGYTSNTLPNGIGNDALVVKYDSAGNQQWYKVLGGFDNDYAQEVHQTSDGGYIVSVDSKSYNQFGKYDCIAYKLTAAGTEMWHTIAGNDTIDTGNQGILITQAGDYVMFGEAQSTVGQGFDVTISKVHQNGALLWQRNLPAIGTEASFSAVELGNGHLLLTGYSNANSSGASPTDAFILETDTAGTPIAYQYAGGPENDITYDVQPSPFGGYLLCGATQKSGLFDYMLLLYDYDGPLSTKTPAEANSSFQIFPNPVAAGQPLAVITPTGNFDLMLYDQLGRVCWTGESGSGFSQITIPATLTAGIYTLLAVGSGNTAAQKVVITRN